MKSVIYREHYIVYEDGRVWSNKSNKWLTPCITKRGYHQINIHRKTIRLHRIIAECFIPNPDNKPTVNHKDRNKLNNCISNLEWNTMSENTQHAYDNGFKASRGDRHYNAKLTKEQVLEIRNSILSRKLLADKYGVSRGHIDDIINNKTWKHL